MPGPDYAKAKRIRELRADGLNQTQIAKILGCNPTNISGICRTHGIEFPRGAAARDQRGEKNPFYKDGLSRSSVERLTRRVITEAGRCLRTCERCGDFNRFQEQNRHHKDKDRSNNTSDNIEVLCVTCHTTEHNTERVRNERGQYT